MGFTPRHRSRVRVKPFLNVQTLERYTYVGGPPDYPMGWVVQPPVYGSDIIAETSRSEMDDVVMDDDTRPIDNPLTVWKTSRIYSETLIRQSGTWVNNLVSPCSVVSPQLGPSLSGPEDADFDQYLSASVLEKIAKSATTQQAVPILPFLGELRDCIEMIRNPVSFLSTFSPRLHKKGDSLLRTLQRNGLSAGSDAWLSYRYGWKPLLNDITNFGKLCYSLDEEYSEYLERAEQHKKVRTTATASSSCVSPPFTGSGSIVEGSHRKVVAVDWTVVPSQQVVDKIDFLRQRLGLFPGDILSAAWELIPYSFVVDWFLPIGDAIGKMTHTPVQFSVMGKYYTHTVKGSHKFFYKDYWSFGNPNSGTLQLVFVDDCEQFSRGAFDLTPGPSAPAPLTNRVISALSLIEQRFRLPMSR